MKNNYGYDIQNGLNWKRYVGCVKIHLGSGISVYVGHKEEPWPLTGVK